jgi:hypothetical protein
MIKEKYTIALRYFPDFKIKFDSKQILNNENSFI